MEWSGIRAPSGDSVQEKPVRDMGGRAKGAISSILEGDELGGRGGTNTGATVTHGLVGNGELAEVVAHHVGLHLNRGEDLALVHTHD